MENATTIRSEIEKELKLGGYTFNSFGQATGLNRGIFSAMLNGNPPKPISVRQMDLITKAFNYPEGWLYDLYVDECFYDGRPHWKRVKPFLIRCVEVGNLRCVEKVLSRLMEDLNHIPTIFALAEELYEGGKLQEAIPFYECVIENEKYQHSERLAISHYKLFRAKIGENTELNLKAAIRFEPFRFRLPECHQLDGLLHLTNIYSSLHKWQETITHSDELWEQSKIIYEEENKRRARKNRNYVPIKTERHLVVYYGQGLLMKAYALQKIGDYENAKKIVAEYADLSWFEGLNTVGKREVEKFKVWSMGNSYTLDLLLGDTSVLPQYVNLLENNNDEILPGLVNILESANRNFFSVDSILDRFIQYIDIFRNTQDVIFMDDYYNFNFQLAIYYRRNKRYKDAINANLQCIQISFFLKNVESFAQSMVLFENNRALCDEGQIEIYKSIIKEVCKDEEGFTFTFAFSNSSQ
ncbi:MULTISPECIES: hypothetical protein [Paenibacillus]|uniref:DNA-binding protein n=1 Tax=Paenibacillus polymyxa TaxID=1406 RepID=A0AAP4ECY7_PAEPO|nr:hypothetical protein [Paenibacillus polymyxa]AIW42564.1 DNA-binding protein [Paenibacillus polymyxa CR1]MDH2333439.1 DNA-binding protein [Paenibacillus polymyxa]